MDLNNMPDLLTAEQVGEYLGVSRSAVYSWCRAKKLHGIKLCGNWRIRKSTLLEWVAEQERASCPSNV
ncbi:helix-turn-helix domain-containing protein [Paenibacillus sp. FSL R5-0887]|jgi:excisionase family DNA binding protein|uniref:helix-turn-helix domain-containing protein n=2 Tax=unclassified Paenibacillus TaxID=185978 RepID=UPI004046FEB4